MSSALSQAVWHTVRLCVVLSSSLAESIVKCFQGISSGRPRPTKSDAIGAK